VTLALDLWPWTFAVYHLWCEENSVPNLNAIQQSAVELLRFEHFILWPWTCVTCCTRLWDNFHQVWPLRTYPCLNNSVFNADTLCHAVTLTFDQLTLKVHGTSNVMWSVCTKFERNRAIPVWIMDNFEKNFHTLCHAVTLTFDLVTLNYYSSSYVMRLNSLQNLSKIE